MDATKYILNVNTVNDLQDLLSRQGINTSVWGCGFAKSIEHLFQEIKSGECRIVWRAGVLTRVISVVAAQVCCTNKSGSFFILKEKMQKFKDGRIRKRNLPQSISEKMKEGEHPNQALRRAVKEELGIGGNILYEPLDFMVKIGPSQSYPGLISVRNIYIFRILLTDEQFNPNGYIEKQRDKTTYFEWVRQRQQ